MSLNHRLPASLCDRAPELLMRGGRLVPWQASSGMLDAADASARRLREHTTGHSYDLLVIRPTRTMRCASKVLGRPARWAASVRSFFERLSCWRPGMWEKDSAIGDRPIDHAKVLRPVSGQPDEPHRQSLDRGPFRRSTVPHLLVGQEPGAARGTVLQAVCPFIVEAVRPVSQRLAIHAADLSGFRSAQS